MIDKACSLRDACKRADDLAKRSAQRHRLHPLPHCAQAKSGVDGDAKKQRSLPLHCRPGATSIILRVGRPHRLALPLAIYAPQQALVKQSAENTTKLYKITQHTCQTSYTYGTTRPHTHRRNSPESVTRPNAACGRSRLPWRCVTARRESAGGHGARSVRAAGSAGRRPRGRGWPRPHVIEPLVVLAAEQRGDGASPDALEVGRGLLLPGVLLEPFWSCAGPPGPLVHVHRHAGPCDDPVTPVPFHHRLLSPRRSCALIARR